jgi:rod shape-determining protein MreC
MLVLASVTVLTLDYHGEASRAITHVRNGVADVLDPFQRGLAAAMHPLGDVVSAVFHYGQLQTDNQRLRSQLGAVSAQLSESNFAAKAEAQVKMLSTIPFAGNIVSLPAEVIAGASSNLEPTLEIDQGTSDGVGVGMPVVGDGGLIGTIISASATNSTVRLITDQRSVLEVLDETTGKLFQIQGAGTDRPLVLTPYGTSSGSIGRGVQLETAGQTNGAPASDYPAGIPVGDVVSVSTSVSGVTPAISVAPFVNLNALLYVAVLQWMPPA